MFDYLRGTVATAMPILVGLLIGIAVAKCDGLPPVCIGDACAMVQPQSEPVENKSVLNSFLDVDKAYASGADIECEEGEILVTTGEGKTCKTEKPAGVTVRWCPVQSDFPNYQLREGETVDGVCYCPEGEENIGGLCTDKSSNETSKEVTEEFTCPEDMVRVRDPLDNYYCTWEPEKVEPQGGEVEAVEVVEEDDEVPVNVATCAKTNGAGVGGVAISVGGEASCVNGKATAGFKPETGSDLEAKARAQCLTEFNAVGGRNTGTEAWQKCQAKLELLPTAKG